MKTTADILKALGDETRLRILALLGGGELCVCEIFAALNLPQSTVSRHLAILRRSGWVIDRREGSWMYYRLVEDDGFRAPILERLLSQLRSARQSLDDLRNLEAAPEHRKPGGRC